VIEQLAAHDLGELSDAVRAERVLGLRRLLDRLEGHWLAELAAVDARGAAGAEDGVQAGSTAGWLRRPAPHGRPHRPPHLWHWLGGGPTDLANLVLLCRAHHRAVHDGGWQLTRAPDGRAAATPPHRRHSRRRQPTPT
jgi:hypothetical protein